MDDQATKANEEILDFTGDTPATLEGLAAALADVKAGKTPELHVITNHSDELLTALESASTGGFVVTDNGDDTYTIVDNPDYVAPAAEKPADETPAGPTAEELSAQQLQQAQDAMVAAATAWNEKLDSLTSGQVQQLIVTGEHLAVFKISQLPEGVRVGPDNGDGTFTLMYTDPAKVAEEAAAQALEAKKGNLTQAVNAILSGASALVGTTLTMEDIESVGGLPPLIYVESVAGNGAVTLGKKLSPQQQNSEAAAKAALIPNDDAEESEYKPDTVEYFLEQKFPALRNSGIPRATKDIIARLREYVMRMGKDVPVQTDAYGGEQHNKLIQIYNEALVARNGEHHLSLEAILWFFHNHSEGAFKDTMLMRFHTSIKTSPARLIMFRRLNNFFASVANPATRAMEVSRQNMERIAAAMLSDEHTLNLLDFFKRSN